MNNNNIVDLPRSLEDWTYETIVDIVRRYEFEPGIFDYKAVLNTTNPEHRNEHNASIRRTASSMANADGGFILFGVRDRSLAASTPDERIVGMPLGADLRKAFADKLLPFQRPIYFEASPRPIELPTDSSQGIFVAYIPQSPLRPHMDESTGIFYRRGEGGKAEIMKFYEVRDQMLYTEGRLQKVRLFRLKLAQFKEQNQVLLNELGLHKTINVFLRFDTSTFEILLADICDLIPPETDLLKKLLNITTTVNLINGIISRASLRSVQPQQSPDAYIERISEEYPQSLNKLDGQLEECEKQLNQLFGSLPGDFQ